MWLQVDTTLPRHPKLARLARRLDIPKAQALGHLVSLWLWCLDYAPDGDLASFDSEEVAEAGLWEGDPTTFLDALAAAGFLEREGDALSIHDWYEYGGKVEARRQQWREASQRYRERQSSVSNRQHDVNMTSSRRHHLEKKREDKTREDEEESREDGATGAASSSSSSSSSPEGLLEGAKDLNQQEMATFLAEHVDRLEELAPYADSLDCEKDTDRWHVAYHARELFLGVRRFEEVAGRRANPAEVALFADTVFSMSGDNGMLAQAVDEAATTWDRPSAKYVAAIVARMSGIDWEPIGRCKEIRTHD